MKRRTLILSSLVVLILLVTGLLVSRITYSFMEPEVPDDVILESGVTATGDTIVFTKAEDIVGTLDQSTFGGTSGNYVRSVSPQVKLIASSKTNHAEASYYVSFSIEENTFQYTNGTNNPEILLTVLDENSNPVTTSIDSLNYVTVGNVSGFDITNKVGVFDIKTDTIETNSSTTGTTKTWTYTITFINKTTDQSINESAVIKVKPVLHKDQETFCEINPNNIGCKYVSNFDPANPSTLYYHGGSLTSGANDGSYRFAGANPSNYVCFGSTAQTCPDANLYRIIGIIPVDVITDETDPSNPVIERQSLVKLIKHEYATSTELGITSTGNAAKYSDSSTYNGPIGNEPVGTVQGFYWSGGVRNNTWSQSTLNTTGLNANFITSLGTSANNIAKVVWKVGGRKLYDITNVLPLSKVYKNEILESGVNADIAPIDGQNEYGAKVGLMYVSDYAYATVPTNWSYILSNYSVQSVTESNWLYKGVYEWTITRNSDPYSGQIAHYYAYYINGNGRMDYGHDTYGIGFGVRPTFYLNSNVTIDTTNHTGSISDPYRIS